MYNPPLVVNLEIQRMRETIAHALMTRNDEMNDLVQSMITEQINTEWFIEELRKGVKKTISEAIDNITRNRDLRSMIEDSIIDCVVLRGEKP